MQNKNILNKKFYYNKKLKFFETEIEQIIESMNSLKFIINKTIEDIKEGNYTKEEILKRFRYMGIIIRDFIVIIKLMIKKVEKYKLNDALLYEYIIYIDKFIYNIIMILLDALDTYLINFNYSIKYVCDSLNKAKNLIEEYVRYF